MLCLTRRRNESIIIADDIVVTLLEIKHDRIRLGISAPKATRILRTEIFIARYGHERLPEGAVFNDSTDGASHDHPGSDVSSSDTPGT